MAHTCQYCGKDYDYDAAKLAYGVSIAGRFCSRRCYLIKEKGMNECLWCHQQYVLDDAVNRIGQDGFQFCSECCSAVHAIEKLKKEGFCHVRSSG